MVFSANNKHQASNSKHLEMDELEEKIDRLLKRYEAAPIGSANRERTRAELLALRLQLTDSTDRDTLLHRQEVAMNRYDYNVAEQMEKTEDQSTQSTQSTQSFVLSQNQIFLKKVMSADSPQNGILLFHGVGVGKTCPAIHIAENFKHIYGSKALVLLPGTTLEANFKQQIYDPRKTPENQCIGDEYIRAVPHAASLPLDKLTTRVNKAIKKNYEIMGVQRFGSIVKDLSTNEIHRTFSNRVIIIDEVHNLRIAESDNDTKDVVETKASVAGLMQVLKHCDGIKLVLLSATPMYDNAREIVLLMNLLYTNDKLISEEFKISDIFDKQGQLTNSGTLHVSDFSTKYISYMRGDDPIRFPLRLYPSVNKDAHVMHLKDQPKKDIYGKKIQKTDRIRHLEIVSTPLGSHQDAVYDSKQLNNRTDESDESEESEKTDEEGGSDDKVLSQNVQALVQITNVTYPSTHTSGFKAFMECFEYVDRGESRVAYREETLKKTGAFLSPSLSPKYASKISRIVDYIQKAEGIVFVYSRYLWGGVLPLALALEHVGFKRYGADSLLQNGGVPKEKVGSYVILSGNSKLTPKREEAITTSKSIENKDGKVIKVILGTEVVTEGIDFKNIREIHLLEPWFNMNRVEQIIGRGVRNGSHAALPIEKRNVTIYQHASVRSSSKNKKETIDMRMYRRSEKKQLMISRVEHVLKTNAMDCSLNSQVLLFQSLPPRTILTSQGKKVSAYDINDKDYTKACDYEKCELICHIPKKPKRTKTSSNQRIETAYLTYEIKLCKRLVKRHFEDSHISTFDEIFAYVINELVKTVASEDQKRIYVAILSRALSEMVRQKDPVTYKGARGSIIYHDGMFIFQPEAVKDEKMQVEERERGVQKGTDEIVWLEPVKDITTDNPNPPPPKKGKDGKGKDGEDENDGKDGKDGKEGKGKVGKDRKGKDKKTKGTAEEDEQTDTNITTTLSALKANMRDIRKALHNHMDMVLAMDMMADRLRDDEIVALLRLPEEETPSGLWEAMVRARYAFPPTAKCLKDVEFVYLPRNDQYIRVKGLNDFEKVANRIKYALELESAVRKDINDMKITKTSVMDDTKDGRIAFKLVNDVDRQSAIDKIPKAAECAKTFYWNTTKLRDIISSEYTELSGEDSSLDLTGYNKVQLCMLYEYMLRWKTKVEKTMYLWRPVHYQWWLRELRENRDKNKGARKKAAKK
jgi:hypothetical protein